MDENERKLLEKTYTLAKENNKILKEMQAARRRAMVFKLIYWLAIIILAFFAFYFIQPFLGQLAEIYGSGSELLDSISDFREYLPDNSD